MLYPTRVLSSGSPCARRNIIDSHALDIWQRDRQARGRGFLRRAPAPGNNTLVGKVLFSGSPRPRRNITVSHTPPGEGADMRVLLFLYSPLSEEDRNSSVAWHAPQWLGPTVLSRSYVSLCAPPAAELLPCEVCFSFFARFTLSTASSPARIMRLIQYSPVAFTFLFAAQVLACTDLRPTTTTGWSAARTSCRRASTSEGSMLSCAYRRGWYWAGQTFTQGGQEHSHHGVARVLSLALPICFVCAALLCGKSDVKRFWLKYKAFSATAPSILHQKTSAPRPWGLTVKPAALLPMCVCS